MLLQSPGFGSELPSLESLQAVIPTIALLEPFFALEDESIYANPSALPVDRISWGIAELSVRIVWS